MKETMKKINIRMSLYMGLAMSFALSVVGNILSDRFSFPIFFITLFASFIISVLIGLAVPMRRIGQAATKNMKQGSIGARALESLISDLIYTPVITLTMICIVRKLVPVFAGMAAKQSEKLALGSSEGKEAMELAYLEKSQEALDNLPPFAIMFFSSLALCFVIAYVLIFFLQPLFLKMLLKRFHVGAPGAGGPGAPDNGMQQGMQGDPQQMPQQMDGQLSEPSPQDDFMIRRTEVIEAGEIREIGNTTDKQ